MLSRVFKRSYSRLGWKSCYVSLVFGGSFSLFFFCGFLEGRFFKFLSRIEGGVCWKGFRFLMVFRWSVC